MLAKEERVSAILACLQTDGKVMASDLAKRFNVTDMTIRRDFDTLVSQGKIIRTHGGAILANNNTSDRITPEASYQIRMNENASGKLELAKLAVRLIKPKQYVFLDSGTTTHNIAKIITREFTCSIITNAVNIASELLSRLYPNVIMIGGGLDLNTWSTRGSLSEAEVNNFHADIAFLGCNAISPNGDIMVGNVEETGLKHQIMEISNKIYLLADSSKFDNYSLITYASVKEFDGIISDSKLSPEIQDKIAELGGKLIVPDIDDEVLTKTD